MRTFCLVKNWLAKIFLLALNVPVLRMRSQCLTGRKHVLMSTVAEIIQPCLQKPKFTIINSAEIYSIL